MSDLRKRAWPSPGDELLLRACLLDGDEALGAWRRWHADTDYNRLEMGQTRLIPLLRENLAKLGVSDPIRESYGTIAKRFWLQNQMLYRHAAGAVSSLKERGIRAMLLKGIPLSLRYYARPDLRPMADTDLLVDVHNAYTATKFFLDSGYTCANEFVASLDDLEGLIEVRHALNLQAPNNQLIDLHWHLFPTNSSDLGALWDAADTFDLHGHEIATLCATDHLLHVCVHGAEWNQISPIRWIPDAHAITARSEIDWPRLVDNARRFDVVEPVCDALTVLQDLLGQDVPARVIEELDSSVTGLVARLDYRLSARKPMPVVGRPLKRYFRYLRTGKPRGLAFGSYMRRLWGVESLFSLVWLGARRLFLNAIGRYDRHD